MKSIVYNLYIVLALVGVFASAAPAGWSMVWNDEFEGTSIDTTKWEHEVDCNGGGNNELQCYTAREQNSKVENGNLVITARAEAGYTGTNTGCTYPGACLGTRDYTSARLRSRWANGASWAYGRFEVRAKCPKGKHLWPAIWMLPSDLAYGQWASSGEIDIMEMRGQETSTSQTTLFYGGTWPNQKLISTWGMNFSFDFSADYHIWVFEWDETEMRFFIDDQPTWTVNLDKMWSDPGNPYTANRQPWDKRFHMLLNVAVGGSFLNGYGTLSYTEAQQWQSPSLYIDYVRVYKRDTSTPPATLPATSAYVVPATTASSGSGTGGKTCDCQSICAANKANLNKAAEEDTTTVSSTSSTLQTMLDDVNGKVQMIMAVIIACFVAGIILLSVGVAILVYILKKYSDGKMSWY